MKVLVAEQSKLYRAILTKLLEDLDYVVTAPATTHEILEAVDHTHFDLIILAMALSDITGAAFCTKLRSREKNANTPVFMITACDEKGLLDEAIASGVTEVFQKDQLNAIAEYLCTFTDKLRENELLSGDILYIEDGAVEAAITSLVLKKIGLKVHHFKNAEDAISSLDSREYDMVLTDVMLGTGMSGIGFTKTLRHIKSDQSSIPVMALTGFDDAARRIELIRAGVNDYVSKPYLQEELIARIKNLLTIKKQSDKIKTQQKQLREMAMTDPLTQLHNRHFLMEVAPKRISEAYRYQTPLTLVMIDLDHFKAINDTRGHAAGDLVLSEVGALLNRSCRNEDISARFGGEEFVLILSHCDEEQARCKAERMRETLENLKPGGIPVTASFGIAGLCMNRKSNFSELFSAADKAVYQAKDQGRNRVVTEGDAQSTAPTRAIKTL